MLDFIFEFEKSTPSHISFRIFGIKLNILKPSIKKERKKMAKYYQSFSHPSDIPKAKDNLRLIQMANASFLQTVDEFFKENNLSYWIDFGTLLGAIRHKGFIPWDDDIDIAMIRDDYEKLIDLFQNDINTDFELVFENNKRNRCFAKLKHKKSDNLFIDIFPYDIYNKTLNDDEKALLSEKITKLTKSKFKKYKTIDDIRNNFKKITAKLILNENKEKIQKPAIFMGVDFPHSWKNKVYDWDCIFPLKKIQFEDKEFFAPNNPDSVLKSIYGNYMSIPKNSYPRHSDYLDINQDEKKILEDIVK